VSGQLISEYAKLLQSCKTPNQVNGLHIQFENSMTPAEVFELAAAAAIAASPLGAGESTAVDDPHAQASLALRDTLSSIPPTHAAYALRWIANMQAFLSLSGKAGPEPYLRQRMGQYIALYSDGNDLPGKRLAICFAGAGQRMMMPVGVFLQHVDASQNDVLVLRDVARNGYRDGIPGIADSLEELIQVIGTNRKKTYASVVSLGVSAGGMPAIWAALQLDLDKGVSVGGNSPADPRWQLWGDEGIKRPFDYYMARLTKPPNLLYIYGADRARDRDAATALSELLPVRTLAVGGNGGKPSGHNALYTLLQRGTLTAFLEEALSTDESWDRLSELAATSPIESGRVENNPAS